MKKEVRKQMILGVISAVLILTGYLNFQNITNENMIASLNDNANNERLGDVELVSSNSLIISENIIENKVADENENQNENQNQNQNENEIEVKSESKMQEENIEVIENNENVIESINTNFSDDYFVKTRLDRENMYSKMLESYEKIINNDQITSDQKAIAVQEIDNINKYKNGIMISENLIKNKGFNDVVILINNDSVSVVVKKDMLLETDIVKIQNIIETKLGFKIENISISCI